MRRALGDRCVGTFDAMPPHTPRSAVILASEAARSVQADLIVTIGGGSVTDAAKMVGLCLGNDVTKPEQLDNFRARIAADALSPDGMEFYGQLSFLKAGIRYSDRLTTVSPFPPRWPRRRLRPGPRQQRRSRRR